MKVARLVTGCLLSVLVTGCATSPAPSLYDPSSFQKLPWAHKSFAENVAYCRNDSLHHNAKWQSYEVMRPRYKACMERYGYHYNGPSELHGNDTLTRYDMPIGGGYRDGPSQGPTAFDPSPLPIVPDTAFGTLENGDKAALYR